MVSTRLFCGFAFLGVLLCSASGRETRLLGYWDFDEITDGVVEDKSGQNHHGRIHGGISLEKGIQGSGLRFSSDEDYVDFGAPVIPPGDFTVSVWIKCDDVEKQFFLGQYRYKDPNRLDLVIREGRVLIQIAEKLSSEVLIKKDRWYHLVYARKGKVMSIFVDGVLVKKGKLPMAVMQDAPLIAGRIEVPGRDTFRFTGVMDELRIYDAALNVEQVKALFTARRIE